MSSPFFSMGHQSLEYLNLLAKDSMGDTVNIVESPHPERSAGASLWAYSSIPLDRVPWTPHALKLSIVISAHTAPGVPITAWLATTSEVSEVVHLSSRERRALNVNDAGKGRSTTLI